MTVVKQMHKSRKPYISQLIYVWFAISASRRVIMSAFCIVDFIIIFLIQMAGALSTYWQSFGGNAPTTSVSETKIAHAKLADYIKISSPVMVNFR